MAPPSILAAGFRRIAHSGVGLAGWILRQTLFIVGRRRPVSLRHWVVLGRWLKDLSGISDPLYPRSAMASSGDAIPLAALKAPLSGLSLGGWALEEQTVRFLWADLHARQPRTILECGSGISTLVFAAYARLERERSGRAVRVISVEQDQQVLAGIERRLDHLQCRGFVHFIHAPLDEESRYVLRDWKDLSGLTLPSADWLLVDGPFGPPGCRAKVIPTFLQWLKPGARWYLHDALRDAELAALQEWSQLPDVIVEGVVPVGKGLGAGWISPGRDNGGGVDAQSESHFVARPGAKAEPAICLEPPDRKISKFPVVCRRQVFGPPF